MVGGPCNTHMKNTSKSQCSTHAAFQVVELPQKITVAEGLRITREQALSACLSLMLFQGGKEIRDLHLPPDCIRDMLRYPVRLAVLPEGGIRAYLHPVSDLEGNDRRERDDLRLEGE